MPEQFQGLASRLRDRLKALGYWRDGKLEVARFCADFKYDPRSFYPWIRKENPRYPAGSLDRLVADLQTTKTFLLHGDGAAGKTTAQGLQWWNPDSLDPPQRRGALHAELNRAWLQVMVAYDTRKENPDRWNTFQALFEVQVPHPEEERAAVITRIRRKRG